MGAPAGIVRILTRKYVVRTIDRIRLFHMFIFLILITFCRFQLFNILFKRAMMNRFPIYTALLLLIHSFSSAEILTGEEPAAILTSMSGDTLFQPSDSIYVIASGSLLPSFESHEILIHKTGFAIAYNCSYRSARWVAYMLEAEETKAKVRRKNHFIADTLPDSCLVVPEDYKRSGYDKGHLAPSADLCWSLQTMQESFCMTNMSPQKPRFNRGMWKKLEDQVRDWAVDNDSVYIVTGPVLGPGLPVIGLSRICIPEFFYKVILDFSGPEVKAIAFVMANKRLTGELSEYAVSVDSVESLTGLDLFSVLPDSTELLVESSVNLQAWLWNGKALRIEDEEVDEE